MAEPPAIRSFLQWVEETQAFSILEPRGQERRGFVSIQKLDKYFTARNPESGRQRLDDLLEAAFDSVDPPIYPENIVPNYTAVFAILLHINKGRYIGEFTEHNALSDSALPFEPHNRPPKFPTCTSDPQFFLSFCKEQWRFSSLPFQRHMLHQRYNSEQILPIIYKEKLGGGGSGTVYKIKLHKQYNELLSDKSKNQLKGESASTFVLKTYITEDARKYYTNEVVAFKKLRPTPNIIEFYCSYIHGDSFNIILEYADKGNLKEYFYNQPEPRTGKDIITFWQGLLLLGEALDGIHQVKPRTDAEGPPIFQGWHQDIKPDNILIVSNDASSPYQWKFKLGDLGLSHFERVVSSGEATTSAGYGTRTYGAPECYKEDDNWVENAEITVKQNVDIWSLGCIYSEAARWVTGGRRGLEAYRVERGNETKLLRDFHDGDCFHNGREALGAVHRSHKESKDSLGRQDYITEKVIEFLVKDMLEVPGGRPTATQVRRKSERILKEAQAELDQSIAASTSMRGQTYPSHQQSPPLPPQLPPDKFPAGRHPSPRATIGAGQVNQAGNGYPTQVLDGEQTHSPDYTLENDNDPFTSPRTKRGSGGEVLPEPPTKPHHLSDGEISYRGIGASLPKRIGSDSHAERNSAPNLATGTIDPGISRSVTGSLTMHSRNINRGNGRERTFEPESYEAAETLRKQKSTDSLSSNSASNVQRNGNFEWRNSQNTQPATPTSQRASTQAASLQSAFGHTREASQGSSPGLSQQEPNRPQTSTEPEKTMEANVDELPSLSIEEALAWKRNKKRGNVAHLNGEHLMGRLEKRDHLFLMDDSKSMWDHWEEAKSVLEALSYIVKDCDPDGTELHFTTSKDHKRAKDTTELLYMLNGRTPTGVTDIDHRLNELLEKYKSKLDKKPSMISSVISKVKREPTGPRPLNIYVLTNGKWESKSTGATTIANFSQKLAKLGKTKSQVGIQFISFGTNPVGLQKMQFLDSKLGQGRPENEFLDIVDTTPSTGNVWKMLLGAINPSFDND